MTHTPGIRISLLGDVMITDGDRTFGAGPAKQSAVLAVLAMNVNRSVPAETLIERVWGPDASPSVRASLYANIARLRKALEPLTSIEIERGDGSGYRLKARTGEIDLWRARDLATRARAAVDDADFGEAAQLWRRVIEFYGDRPLGNISGAWADIVRARLRQERSHALEELFAIELGRGKHREVLDEITAAVAADPLMENLVAQLMHALYLCGRKSEALTLYAMTEQRLGDEMGIEPRQTLRDMLRRIRGEDSTLEPRSPAAGGPAAGVEVGYDEVVPRQLPRAPGGFIGRAAESADLSRIVRDGRSIVLVTGMAGVGKTLLALRWARSAAERYKDGQLFVDLLGSSDETPRHRGDVLAGFLRALGVPGSDIPDGLTERTGLYRRLTADRSLLVVLDNAADFEQVEPLIPAGRSQVIVTGRERMPRLSTDQIVSLDVLGPDESVELLSEWLPASLLADDPAATRRLVELCGGLPLALRIAAANLSEWPEFTVADYVAELSTGDRFTTLAVPGDVHTAVLPAFDRSYRRLPEPARAIFRAVAAAPGQTVPAPAVAAMTGREVDEVSGLIDVIETAHLVRRTENGSCTMHDLLKEYGRRVGSAEEAATSRAGLFAWYTQTARAAAEAVSPGAMMLPTPVATIVPMKFGDGTEAMSWFTAEELNLVAVAVAAGEVDASEAWLLSDALRLYWARVSDFVSWERTAQAGLDAATRRGDAPAVSAMHYLLSMRARMAGDYVVGERHLLAALPAAQETEDPAMLANIYIGLADTASYHGDAFACVEHSLAAMSVMDELPLRQNMVVSTLLAIGYQQLGELEHAEAHVRRIVDHLRVVAPQKLLPAIIILGEVLCDLGRLAEAEEVLTEAYEAAVTGTMFIERIRCMAEMSRLRLRLGQVDEARRCARLAIDFSDEAATPIYRPLADLASARTEPDPQRALDSARAVLESTDAPDYFHHRFDVRLVIAQALQRLERHREALDEAENLIREAEQRGFKIQKGQALNITAAALLSLGETGQAIGRAEEALNLHRITGHRMGEASSHLLLFAATGDDDHRRQAQRLTDETGGVVDPWSQAVVT